MAKSNGRCNCKCANGSKCRRRAGWGMGNGGTGPCKIHADNKPGRPLADINPKIVKRLCRIACTLDEIAHICGVNKSTISRRFATDIEKWRADGKMSLRRAQYKTALGGNATMQIWLGKQELGQKDTSRYEHTGADGKPLEMVHKSEKQIRDEICTDLGIIKPESEVMH